MRGRLTGQSTVWITSLINMCMHIHVWCGNFGKSDRMLHFKRTTASAGYRLSL